MSEDLCVWCRRPAEEHDPPRENVPGGTAVRFCPVPGVSSQFFTPPPRPEPARGCLTESDLLFAVAALESMSWALEPGPRLAAARHEMADRYQQLKRGRGFTEAVRQARAEWLGRFLAERQGESRRADELEVLLAWESGELSEGQTCRLLGGAAGGTTDPVTARGMREAALAAARKRWERWRACNPPSPG